MGVTKKASIWFLGLAMFSMFFGAGNLIFPLAIGQLGQDNFGWGLAGFLITGVLVPFLGVITMVVFNGNYNLFFGSMGKTLGFLFTFALLTVWIPLGSSPRCITLAFVNIKPYLGSIPLWLFSLVYCIFLIPMSYSKSRALDILGYVLTPLLILCLFLIVVQGVRYSPILGHSEVEGSSLFIQGLLEGYNTMDLIASFFFASTIIASLREQASEGPVKIALKACTVGVFILGLVYVGLMGVAAANASLLMDVPKDQLLAKLVSELLGPKMQIIATLSVVLACITTSIALLIVYADFLRTSVFKEKVGLLNSMLLTSVVTFGMSILGFQGISALTGPLLEIFYPCLIILMTWNLVFKRGGLALYNKFIVKPEVGESVL